MRRGWWIIVVLIAAGGVLLIDRKPLPTKTEVTRPANRPSRRLSRRTAPRRPRTAAADAVVPTPVTPPENEDGPLSVTPEVGPEDGAIPGEYLFRLYNRRDQELFLEAARRLGAEILGESGFLHVVRIRVDGRKMLDRLLAEGPTPVDSGPNYRVEQPPDPLPNMIPPEGGFSGFGDKALSWLGADEISGAWGSGVSVAILDTRLLPHPSLPERQILRTSGFVETGSGEDGPTHAAAIASLLIGSSVEVQGIAPGASILSIPVLRDDGTGDSFSLAEGIMEAVRLGANVINLSLGSSGDSFTLREAIEYAISRNVVVVAAAGNGGGAGVSYPARYPGVIAVGGVDASGQYLPFSNRGPELDVAAPALSVAAAGAGDGYSLFSGTSAAAPLVAGAVAIVESEERYRDVEAVVDEIRKYSDDAGLPGADDLYGEGILNLERLLARDKPGIYDIAVYAPYLRQADGDPDTIVMIVSAENRGTEPLRNVTLEVEVVGTRRSARRGLLQVGEVLSREFSIRRDRVAAEREVVVLYRATLPGVTDSRPGNNAGRTVFSLREDGAGQ